MNIFSPETALEILAAGHTSSSDKVVTNADYFGGCLRVIELDGTVAAVDAGSLAISPDTHIDHATELLEVEGNFFG